MASWTKKLMMVALAASNAAMAEEAPDWRAETLSGDWGGARSSLYDKGVSVDITHKSDLLANTSGGRARGGVWLMNTEAAVGLDMDKLAGWRGGSAFVQYHVQHGDQPKNFNQTYVGSFAGVSNIETGTSTGQFYQAWLQQNSADDRLSLLGGLYAIDSEFYVTESSGLFIQPPY
ncbi:MAG TPA: carbohydrate porin, partial [Gallionella sp.]|nr:carbohydrate porin [Gallionella sp.]